MDLSHVFSCISYWIVYYINAIIVGLVVSGFNGGVSQYLFALRAEAHCTLKVCCHSAQGASTTSLTSPLSDSRLAAAKYSGGNWYLIPLLAASYSVHMLMAMYTNRLDCNFSPRVYNNVWKTGLIRIGRMKKQNRAELLLSIRAIPPSTGYYLYLCLKAWFKWKCTGYVRYLTIIQLLQIACSVGIDLWD